MSLTPFHVAVQVRDLAEARHFYKDIIGCTEGRSDATWVDFNLYGHHFACHLNPNLGKEGKITSHFSSVDGQGVPVPHCGVVLEMSDWRSLAERLKRHDIRFVIEPPLEARRGEQVTLFLLDPTGNALEFKAFRETPGQPFAT